MLAWPQNAICNNNIEDANFQYILVHVLSKGRIIYYQVGGGGGVGGRGLHLWCQISRCLVISKTAVAFGDCASSSLTGQPSKRKFHTRWIVLKRCVGYHIFVLTADPSDYASRPPFNIYSVMKHSI